MNESMCQKGVSFAFQLPGTGIAGETRTAADLAGDNEYVLVVLLRSHYCPLSRQFVQTLAEAYEAFARRSTAIVPVLPDRRGRAAVWQRRYDLPFGLLADSDETVDDETEFETFGQFQQRFAGLPGAILFEADDDALRFVRTVGDEEAEKSPSVDTLLDAIEDYATDRFVGPAERGTDPETVSGS